jgi:hypothetical protein
MKQWWADFKWWGVAGWWREFKCRHDLHDYPDGRTDENKNPMHFYSYTCSHCSRKFER